MDFGASKRSLSYVTLSKSTIPSFLQHNTRPPSPTQHHAAFQTSLQHDPDPPSPARYRSISTTSPHFHASTPSFHLHLHHAIVFVAVSLTPPPSSAILLFLQHLSAGRFDRKPFAEVNPFAEFKDIPSNKRYIEGSIAESYIVAESVRYCMEYMPNPLEGNHRCTHEAFLEEDGEFSDTGPLLDDKITTLKTHQFQQIRRWAHSIMSSAGNSQQPSRFSAPQPSSQSSGTAKEKAKLLIIIGPTGIVVGANSRKWSNRVGDYVRSCISVKYSDFRQVPQNFKDDVWRNLMEEAMPENPIDKVDAWLAGHQKENGTVLPSAKPLYDQVKEIKTKRKSGEDGSSSTIENDGLTQVFGKDIKGRLRGVGSHISKKQMVIVEIEKQREWQRIRKKQKMMPLRMK
ncbi:hypothetical protein LguiA_025778 [Lonicera macranthoides]